jgi:CubicO group peptidase (beta-lactamase class C family)
MKRVLVGVALSVLVLGSIAFAQRGSAAGGLQKAASPEAVGFSKERVGRVDTLMQNAVDQHSIAGAVTLVMRHGQVAQLKAFGMADIEHNVPMKADTIFRLASASKIVTTVALMTLVEEGKILVTDPVSKYIPAFRNTTVAVPAPPNAPAGTPPFTVVPAKRQITIHDVLTKTPGIAYPSGPTRSLYEEAGFHQWYFADMDVPMCTMMERLAKLPFHYQPGEYWTNGYTADILGCVIEKISGMNLGEFERTRIFEPLKMPDTTFFLPKSKESRLAAVYRSAPGKGVVRAEGKWTEGQGDYVEGSTPAKAYSGGAGLLTTANDYGRFLQMLLNGGQLEGIRVLSRKTTELMFANHVGKIYKGGQMGFGFNVEVTTEPGGSDRLGSVGDWGWQGAYFPRYLVDPHEQTVSLFLAQLSGYGGASNLHDAFTNLVYQAIEDNDDPKMTTASRETGSRSRQ